MIYRFLLILFFLPAFVFAENSIDIKTSYYISEKELNYNQINNIKDFIPSTGKNLGIIDKDCWVKLEIKNNTDEIKNRVFKFKFPYMDDITVYKDSKTIEKYGRTNNYNKTIKSLDNNVFRVQLSAFEKRDVYIKITSSFTIKTFLEDYSEVEYINDIFFQKMLFYFCYGILFSLILYNFFIWYSTKKKEFLYYVLFHFIFLLGIISWTGFGFEYIWPNFPIFNYYSYGIIGNLLYGFQILFIINYLDTQNYLPKTTSLLKLFTYTFFIFSVSSVVIQLTLLYELFSIVSTFLLLGATIYLAFVEKLKLAFYILFAELIIISGNFFMVLSDMGIINGTFFSTYFFVWGASIEVILMSLALAYKYKSLEMEKNFEEQKRRQTEEMLMSKQKLFTLGETFNNMVHQFRQPLSQINSIIFKIESDYVRKKLDEKNLENKLNSIEHQTNYLSKTLDYFRDFSSNKDKIESFRLNDLIDEVISITSFMIKQKDINIIKDLEDKNITLNLNKNDLVQVFIIIMVNAKDAILKSSVNNPEVIIKSYQKNGSVLIEISNNAGAIDHTVLDKIFDPYFTTKDHKEGTGLGLYIAKLIVEEKLHSLIEVESKDQFTTFTLRLK